MQIMSENPGEGCKKLKILGEDHEFCKRCGRKLKSVQARQRGYGAVCEKKLKIEAARRLVNL